MGWASLLQHVDFAESDIVVLPELPASAWFGASKTFDQARWDQIVADHDRMLDGLRAFGNAIVVASRATTRDGVRQNVAFIWSKETGAVDRHAKTLLPEEPGFHEQSWYHESDDQLEPLEMRGISIGVMLCSELMWTERARLLGVAGAQVIAVPRATMNAPRWKAASQMAAIASGAFVLTSNRSGQAEGNLSTEFGGTSMIVDPDGALLAETSKEKPFASAAIDLATADQAKTSY
ncbi:MAG: carbon-nitrogen hydrolase family protein, partial [Chloroflexota bacterium]|nr:carbon-nitrogen hydrolase family protein [Chloroflexota bacterium]